MLWQDDKIHCSVESTTYCNAKCPQCDRTNPNGLGFSNICELKHVSLKEWIASYSKSYQWISGFHFSGSYGDCFMNPEIRDIFTHIRENSNCKISFSTNGSLRDPDFFWELGVENRKNISGIFDIDGWTQETHERYRVNTDLNKIKENVESFAATDNPTKIFTVVFKHNQGDVEKINEWTKSLGIQHEILQSSRFDYETIEKYTYKGKEYTLEQTTDPKYLEVFDTTYRRVRDHRHSYENVDNIKCVWGIQNKVFIDENQNVWPCCYWPWKTLKNKENPKSGDRANVYQRFYDNLQSGEYNLHNFNLNEIMSKDFYKNDLLESFKNQPSNRCKRICGISN